MFDLTTLKKLPVEDREFYTFCLTLAGEIAKRTCTEIINDESNPVPVSVQFEGVGESGYRCDNIIVTGNTIENLVLEEKISTLEIYSRLYGKVEWSLDDASLDCFKTLECGAEMSKSDLRMSGKTLYFRSNQDDIIEITQWSST